MDELFDRFDIDQVTMTCNRRGEPYGIRFTEMTLLSNSRLALEAAEFARDAGRYRAFHERMFRACFTEGRNIGDMNVILDVAGNSGLDATALTDALADRRYGQRVEDGSRRAREAGVTAIPTFIIEGQPAVTGAVNESILREKIQAAMERQ
jgi:predicted DsbA family dithiol-disulfide isomerase